MPNKPYEQFLKETNNNGLSQEQLSTLRAFGEGMYLISAIAAANAKSKDERMNYNAVIAEKKLSIAAFTSMGDKKKMGQLTDKDIDENNKIQTLNTINLNEMFNTLSKPEYLKNFVDNAVLSKSSPFNRNGRDGKKIFIESLAIFNAMYGANIDIEPYVKELGMENTLNDLHPAAPGENLTASEKLILKTQQDHTLSMLDSVSAGLSAKHRTGLGFGVGTSSTELKATKTALADYKAFLADPGNPKFEGKSELDMVTALKNAADNYMRLKRENGSGDTSSPDWLPETKMGQARFMANKAISDIAQARIAVLNKKTLEANKTVNDKIADIAEGIDPSLDEDKYNINDMSLYTRSMAADMLTWITIANEHGDEPVKDNTERFKEERKRITNSPEFKATVNAMMSMPRDKRLELLKDPQKLETAFELKSQKIKHFDKKLSKFSKGSAGDVYYENAKSELVGHSFGKNSVMTMLALAQYITDKGGDAKFDRKEFDDKYYDQIDEETIDIFIKKKNENRLETDLMDPNDLLDDYDQTMDNTYRIYTDDLKTNLTPGSITKFQDDIKEIIYGRPPQNEKEFEEFKAEIKRNTADIIATKTLWKKPDTRTQEEIEFELGRKHFGHNKDVGGGRYMTRLSKNVPKGIKSNKWNAMEPDEKAKVYGKILMKEYKAELEKKYQERDELSRKIYEERDDFGFMFDKAKTWEDVVKLAKKTLLPTAKAVMSELSKASKELAGLKDKAQNNVKDNAKENTIVNNGPGLK